MRKDYHLTREGREELEKELEALKARRGEIAEKIKAARDFGDISENAEYDTARDEQAQVESRIAEIEEILQNSTLIVGTNGDGLIVLGSKVTLESDRGVVEYTLVSSVEADPAEKKISDESPIGQALMGKKKGDKVEITTPSGKLAFKIQKVA